MNWQSLFKPSQQQPFNNNAYAYGYSPDSLASMYNPGTATSGYLGTQAAAGAYGNYDEYGNYTG
jgi:hypothetical protein